MAAAADGIAMVTPPQPAPDSSDYVMLQAMPAVDSFDAQMGAIVDTLRANLPGAALVGDAPAENLDLQRALTDYLPLIVGIILIHWFGLLLLALQAPPIAVPGTVVSVAVLLDGVLIRLVLLRLTGHAAWWSPAWLRRILPKISFAH